MRSREEGELAPMSREFEYLHRKSRCQNVDRWLTFAIKFRLLSS